MGTVLSCVERTHLFLSQSVNRSSSFLFCRSFSESFHSLCPEKPWLTKLSSAGLVYLHFGRQVLAQLTQMKEGDKQLEVLYDKVRGQCFSYNTQASHWVRCRCFPLPHLCQNVILCGTSDLNMANFLMEWGGREQTKCQ